MWPLKMWQIISWQSSKCGKTKKRNNTQIMTKLKLWQHSNGENLNCGKLKLWKIQFVTKLKLHQILKFRQKIQIVTHFWQNSYRGKAKIVTKLELYCNYKLWQLKMQQLNWWQNSKCDKTQIVTKLKILTTQIMSIHCDN